MLHLKIKYIIYCAWKCFLKALGISILFSKIYVLRNYDKQMNVIIQ